MRRSTRLAVARLLFMVLDKDLRERFCSCRRPVDRFVDRGLQEAMDAVERETAGESTED